MSTSLGKSGLNSSDYVELIKIFTLALEKHKDYMNSLNVFPVPDADTGTNMYVSVKGIQDSLKEKSNSFSFNELSKIVADFALLSAQGNSGLLVAQLFRGIHSAMKDSNEFGLKELRESLDKTYEYAFTSVHEPQEGTMITIMRECASKAKELENEDLSFVEVFEEIAKIAKIATDETINQMELLKQANVIDSGAYGFSVMLEAAKNCLGLDSKGNVNLILDGTYSFIPNIPKEQNFNKEFFQDSSHDDWGYCVVFAISGENIDIENIKNQLSDKGRSLVVSGSDSVCKVHIHSEKPDEILEFSRKFGEISNENISNMDEQFDEMKSNVSQKFKNNVSIVAITSGEGITDFLQKNTFGSISFLTNQEFNEINEIEMKNYIEKIESENILIIGNSKKVIDKFESLPNIFENNIKVIESSNDAELISAIFAFSPETDLNENMINISSALEENISITLNESDISSLIKNDKLKDLDQRFITILSHEDKSQSSKKIQQFLENNFELDGIELITHSSSEYDFIVSVE